MPFLATIAGLLVGKEQADTIRALEQKGGGREKQRDESLANHEPNLLTYGAQCQTRGHEPGEPGDDSALDPFRFEDFPFGFDSSSAHRSVHHTRESPRPITLLRTRNAATCD